jgi:hypothetical protein
MSDRSYKFCGADIADRKARSLLHLHDASFEQDGCQDLGQTLSIRVALLPLQLTTPCVQLYRDIVCLVGFLLVQYEVDVNQSKLQDFCQKPSLSATISIMVGARSMSNCPRSPN